MKFKIGVKVKHNYYKNGVTIGKCHVHRCWKVKFINRTRHVWEEDLMLLPIKNQQLLFDFMKL